MNSIRIYQGNRLEDLAHELGSLMHENRRKGFSLEPDIILVNNFEMSQWLSIRIAEEQGICANVNFRLFGSFAWSLAAGLMEGHGSTDVVTADQLRWLVFRTLQEIVDDDRHGNFNKLREYLKKHQGPGIYHVALQLSDLFDRYLNYRFDMIEQWNQGRCEAEHGWQPAFWKRLSDAAEGRFRVSRLKKLIEAMREGKKDESMDGITIPSRIYLFGVSYLPPLHLDILSALSSMAEIHMFIMTPCREYWIDTVSPKSRVRLGRFFSEEEVNALFPTGNRLLSSLGYAGRSFLASLYSFEPGEGRDYFRASSDNPEKASLLAMIQDDILELRQNEDESQKRIITEDDRSLTIHSCHSPLREVEVLHDQIVAMMGEDHTLKPHHILVMAPSMEKYAPFVQAVFGSAPACRHIPFSIADLGLSLEDPVVRAFLCLFSLPSTEFTATDVLDVLEQPVVASRMGIDSDSLILIRQWVQESGIRRGIHTLSSSTEERQNTWVFGIDRLFASAAMDSQEFCMDTGILPLPFPVEGGNYTVLAALSNFFFSLAGLSNELKAGQAFDHRQWHLLFMKIIEEFITEEPETDPAAQPLVERLDVLCTEMKNAGVGPVDYGTMLGIIGEELGRNSPPRSFISGNVLFSSLVPMRSIPFRIICLLGMNDADFPRRPSRPAFDLMQKKWRPGDRIPREEDRYLFLETLISAREKLLISYTGRRDTDNAPLNPSLVVSELLDYICDGFTLDDGNSKGNASLSDHMVTEHPLQPFSMRYLKGEQGVVTFAKEWLPLDKEGGLLEKQPPEPLCSTPLPLDEDEKEGLLAVPPWLFASLFGNPARFFLQNRLMIDVYDREQIIEDSEPFFISRKAKEAILKHISSLDQSAFNGLMAETERFFDAMKESCRGAGMLPAGTLGDIQWEQDVEGLFMPLLEKIAEHGAACGTASADFILKAQKGMELHISGSLGFQGKEGGLLEYRLKVYTDQRLSLWIRHLLLALGREGPFRSVIVCPDTNVVIDEVASDDAQQFLSTLSQLYIRGLEEPLSFLPGPSWDYAKIRKPARAKKNETEREREQKARERARSALCYWNSNGAIKDRWTDYLYRGNHMLAMNTIDTEEFRNISMKILAPLLDHLKSGRQ